MGIGVWQVVLILLVVLIIFGAGKLPKVMGDVAKGVKNFKEGMKDDDKGDDEPRVFSSTSSESTLDKAHVAKKDEAANG